MPPKIAIPVFFTIGMLIPFAVFSQDTVKTSSDNSVIKSKIVYNSRDSIRFDVKNQKVFLFGEAGVKYEDMLLTAEYIEFDMVRNIAFAHGGRDSAGNVTLDSAGLPIGDPVFSDAGKSFDAKEITYNFETRKGKIREVTTMEGEAFIHAKYAKKDTGDVYYIKSGRYTTCDYEHPHFFLKATKLKIIPDDKIITGPAYLVVSDVPTPLALPFGVFPNKKGRKSGVLIPFYGESNLGYFLKDGGYYFGLSDRFDLALRGDIFSKGSYGLKAHTNYNKRYKYSGNLGINFSQIQISEKEYPDYTSTQDFFLRWNHVQDAKSNPTSRFSANVNAGSRTYQTFNSNTSNEYLANTFQSNVAWNKTWQGRPFNLSMSANHSQNTIRKTVDVTLPEIAFTRSRGYPFKRKNHVGKPNVFEKIGTSFSLSARNQVSTYDSLLFDAHAVDRMRNGLKATVPISTSFNVGPFIVTPSAGMNGYGYFQTIHKYWNADSNSLYVDTLRDFKSAFDANAALSVSTKLYGMYMFKRGAVKAIRHVITPSGSLSWRPDFSARQFGYYEEVQIDSLGNVQLYSYFQNGIFGGPQAGKSGFLNFAINNNLEMKLRPSQKDTSGKDRKIILIENFSISSSYNIAAEHFKWSTFNLNARTRLFKSVDITLIGILDPYAYDSSLNKRIERFEYNVTGRLGRLTSAVFSLSTSLQSLAKKQPAKKPAAKGIKPNEDELRYVMTHPQYYVDFNVPWNLAVYYNVVYAKPALTDTVIQTFTLSGDLSVTENWKVGFQSGFDIVKKDFTYTSFDIYRDLHCWEMRLNWIPFGFRKSYMISVAVKASVLQDLKLSRKRDWYDYN